MTVELHEALALIEELGGGDFGGAKPERLVSSAEGALGLTFPPSYREFLLRLGCGAVRGLEILGVIHEDFDNSGYPDVVWATRAGREHGLPSSLVLVNPLGDGTYFALDTSATDERGESPVVAWYVTGQIEPVATDFGAFLLGELRALASE